MDFEKQRERELERKEHGRLGGYVDPEHPEKGVYFVAPEEDEAQRAARAAKRDAAPDAKADDDADEHVIEDAHVGPADQKIEAAPKTSTTATNDHAHRAAPEKPADKPDPKPDDKGKAPARS